MRSASTRSLFVVLAAIVSTLALQATPLTVTELGMGANQVVRITSSTLSPSGVNVYAGVVKLKVNGVFTDAFCIDPWHWSVAGTHTYESVELWSAPKDPVTGQLTGGMGVYTAAQIQRLWNYYYTPSIDNLTAAALQVKIWQLVDAAVPNGSFSLLTNSTSLNSKLAQMNTYLAQNPNAPQTDLVGITTAYTPTRSGQDYVIPRVPDAGATVLLAGLGLGALAIGRRYRRLIAPTR